MRCVMCAKLSLSHICSSCRNTLQPTLHLSHLDDGTKVYSFYRYDEIETLLLTKHTDLGFYIYSVLASLSFKPFAAAFEYPYATASIAVDDVPRHGYAHTALLNRTLTCKAILPHHGILRARNKVHYAGESLEYRRAHPRDFTCKAFGYDEVIVVDDIITTGTTLSEAVARLKREGKTVLFCVTLAYVATA